MAGVKRKHLTTDDLMRLQEGPSMKRIRTRVAHDQPSLPPDADSEESEGGAGSDEHDESDSGDSSDLGESEDDSGDEDAEEETPPQLAADSDDRFSFASRIRGQPKSGRAASTTSLATPKHSSWSSMSVSAPLQTALSTMSIREPTEIQSACIPPLLEGRDCIGNAKTGSGKTIAFALPILQRLAVDPYGIFALVLTPTRELAFQIAEQFAVLGGPVSVRTAVVVGGMDMMAQALELNARPHVVVATPGRIVDHLRSGSGEWDLSRVRFLVLDEADRLLTPTFAPELAHLFGVLPRARQTCLFTATWTPAVEALADAPPRPGKQRPFVHRMTSAGTETVESLEQHYILVPSHVRESYLHHLLCNPPASTLHLLPAQREPAPSVRGRNTSHSKSKRSSKKAAPAPSADDGVTPATQPPPTIVFCNRARTAAYLARVLQGLGVRCAALHGGLTQRERLGALGVFRARVVSVLVSTDVGARGLDVADVALVVNWDLPQAPEEYTHRVGRTARAGRAGVAVSFVTERDEERVLAIEARIKTRLGEMTLPEGKVLEHLNAVSTAKRLASMELHDSDFGKREEINRTKRKHRAKDT